MCKKPRFINYEYNSTGCSTNNAEGQDKKYLNCQHITHKCPETYTETADWIEHVCHVTDCSV